MSTDDRPYKSQPLAHVIARDTSPPAPDAPPSLVEAVGAFLEAYLWHRNWSEVGPHVEHLRRAHAAARRPNGCVGGLLNSPLGGSMPCLACATGRAHAAAPDPGLHDCLQAPAECPLAACRNKGECRGWPVDIAAPDRGREGATRFYRKRPVVIEAVQVTEAQIIPTLEGNMTASPGDYVITGVKGERYPCKPDIFAMTYEPAPERADLASLAAELEGAGLGTKELRLAWVGRTLGRKMTADEIGALPAADVATCLAAVKAGLV